MRCDVLLWDDVAARGVSILKAMIDSAPKVGIECTVCNGSPTGAPWLMAYGLGHIGRKAYISQHLKNGGRLIGWDLPYWSRGHAKDKDHPMRLTIDADHPWRMIQKESPERWDNQGIQLREDCDPEGKIMIVGMGKKAKDLYPDWEKGIQDRLFNKYPRRKVVYRPKSKWVEPIEQALRGKSFVYARHSNVAVDACIAGIPVECQDGAAYALYKDNPRPTIEQRLEFLRSLAWWQWKPSEAIQAWDFIKKKLSA